VQHGGDADARTEAPGTAAMASVVSAAAFISKS
jgi:hypothetical protein